MELIEASDGIRRPERFQALLLACEADARGRLGLEENDYPQRHHLLSALRAANGIDTRQVAETLQGIELGAAIRERRLAAVSMALSDDGN